MRRNFEIFKSLLLDLAESKGITEDDLDGYDEARDEFNWHINWKRNLDDWFEMKMQRICDAIELYEAATKQGDLLAARAGLQDVRLATHDLMNFFDDIREDLIKISSDSRFGWPDFPDDYKIPEVYNYSKK
ncbi:hypothetical protein ACKI2N_023550 [Cupriavidus sp. 30B13]|uniref:hypothetical protein n=1 Tax=Cupriavidus sp. 30B13 TaxID=3384241 RepID=UPI003B90DDB9